MPNDVITFGCRLNTYESEVIKTHLHATDAEGNTVVFNSCAVTAEAERQLRQAIRKTRRERPDARIVVTGCAAQIDPAKYAAMEEVDVVLGNAEKLKAEAYTQDSGFRGQDSGSEAKNSDGKNAESRIVNPEFFVSGHEKIRVNDIMSVKETAGHLVAGFEGKARAFVQVQNGCNHRCTFCIIPYGRGNSRSVPAGEVVTQIRALVDAGYKEVVLTGVDITDYGKDLPGQPTLGSLSARILKLVPELPRLRLSSVDPVEVDEDILRLLAEEPRLMPHLHLSLQAGDDMVLKRMKRRHLSADVRNVCAEIRTRRPDVVFGADVIAGFPTETDEMALNTLRLIEECDITYLHVFPYSARKGTPAAKMPQVPGDIRKARAAELRGLGEMAVQRLHNRLVGTHASVLIERNGLGHSEHFAQVKLLGDFDASAGALVKVQLTGIRDGILAAVQCNSAHSAPLAA